MKKRHTDLTPRQVQDRLANRLFMSIILAWAVMTLIFSMAHNQIAEAGYKDQGAQDDNIIDSRPTPRWRLNSNGFSQRYVHLNGSTRDERAIELLEAYDFPWEETWEMMKDLARDYRIQPELFICIAYADSSLWRFLKTDHNYGNVWNNDRGDRVYFNSTKQGFEAIAKYALNGRYLKHKYTVDRLSPALWKPWPYYATSPENRHVNTTNCLGMIHNKHIPDNRNFRW